MASAAVTTEKKKWTDEELMAIEHEGKVELVNGELILMPPAGIEQDDVIIKLIQLLLPFVDRGIGHLHSPQAGFRPHDNLRSPDVAFTKTERLPLKSPKGFARFIPNLAIEVLAPDEKPKHYEVKIREYFSWGVELVWLIDPNTFSVFVYRSPDDVLRLKGDDELTGEPVLAGFSCRVNQLFQ